MHKFMFDKILFVSQSVENYLKNIGVNESKLFYTKDVVNLAQISQIQSDFRTEFGIGGGR